MFGCSRFQRGIRVIPRPNQNVLNLSGNDVVEIMRSAGFSDEQIVQYGLEVHDGLARSGAVQIDVNGRTEAIFAIKGSDVYISTKLRGMFIYNINTGWGVGDGRFQ